ncbi:MAG: hypothetical protein HYV09_21935 [Deltaproteobacteria bacterium]|nr:hypothetical protein [Deltaproteobacteria bacterium]
MSEHQCYEFLAVDRPLSAKQMAELRAISSRAEISPTRFWNEYHWGDLRADAMKLMARYFDAHLYFANWGTRRLMLRVPKARLDAKALRAYIGDGNAFGLKSSGDHVVLEFVSDDEEPHYDDDIAQGALTSLVPLRAELMSSDLRPAYLAWLLRLQSGELDDDDTEPPVPAGLGRLTAAQDAMVDFLRIDPDLLQVAAGGSAEAERDDVRFRHWVAHLPQKQKDAWLDRAANDPELALGAELLRTFRASQPPAATAGRRTVGELEALAEARRAEREKAAAGRAKRTAAAAERKRQQHLSKLAGELDRAWARLETLVASSEYDEAVQLAIDLRDLAQRDGNATEFADRFQQLRKRQERRRGFFDRWKRTERSATSR